MSHSEQITLISEQNLSPDELKKKDLVLQKENLTLQISLQIFLKWKKR